MGGPLAQWCEDTCAVCPAQELGPGAFEHIRPAGLGTLESYADMMGKAGLQVTQVVDEFAGEPCWGSTPPEDREAWLGYGGRPPGELFQDGKRALDAASAAFLFTGGTWLATRAQT